MARVVSTTVHALTEDKGVGLRGWLTGPKAKTGSVLGQPVPLDPHRVAVLPFANMSPNPQDEYFADGMTEEVISTLSRVPNIEVISRTSVMQYKKNPKPIKEVSRELEVGTVLEGGVRKDGNKLRITIQMIDAGKDRHLWAESYDREMKDAFAIQSEVATRVAEAIRDRPSRGKEGSSRKRPTTSTEAYTLYLRGRYHWNKRILKEVEAATGFFEQAVTEDPRFALGYVGLADCYAILASSYQIDQTVNHEKAKAMVTKALELDPELAEAHATRGLSLMDDFRLREAESELRNALALNPNYAPAYLWYHLLLLFQGRMDEALERIKKGIELDPLSSNMNLNLANYYSWSRKDNRTFLELSRRSIDLDPSYAHAHFAAGFAYGKLKMFDDARREYNISLKLLQKGYPLLDKFYDLSLAYLEDDKETVRKLLPGVKANPEDAFTDGLGIAVFCFYLDQIDEGFEWLERAYSKKEHGLLYIQIEEIPEKIRKDPRYLNLLNRIGFN